MNPQELEELSFRNLVEWHRDDLVKVMNGSPATTIFTEDKHIYLKKHGILQRVPHRRYTRPTPKAQKILMQSPLEKVKT